MHVSSEWAKPNRGVYSKQNRSTGSGRAGTGHLGLSAALSMRILGLGTCVGLGLAPGGADLSAQFREGNGELQEGFGLRE